MSREYSKVKRTANDFFTGITSNNSSSEISDSEVFDWENELYVMIGSGVTILPNTYSNSDDVGYSFKVNGKVKLNDRYKKNAKIVSLSVNILNMNTSITSITDYDDEEGYNFEVNQIGQGTGTQSIMGNVNVDYSTYLMDASFLMIPLKNLTGFKIEDQNISLKFSDVVCTYQETQTTDAMLKITRFANNNQCLNKNGASNEVTYQYTYSVTDYPEEIIAKMSIYTLPTFYCGTINNIKNMFIGIE